MTKALRSLVAAHIHHSKVSQRARNGENTHHLGVQFPKKKHHGSMAPKGLVKSGEYRAPKSKPRARHALTPISGNTFDNTSSSIPAVQEPASSRSFNPKTLPTVTPSRAVAVTLPTVKLASDKVIEMQSKSSTLETRIQDLEALAREFKGRVRAASHEYKALKAQIDHVSEEFEALEDDHISALDTLDEERSTTRHYIERLRTAEAEILHLCSDDPTVMGGYSQTDGAIYDRYA